MHENSIHAFRAHVAPRIPCTGRILEIGADGQPSRYALECGSPIEWETADLAAEAGAWTVDGSPPTIVMPSEYEIPVAEETYDVVLSGQVIEHVREIWTWMLELGGVTKCGGRVITISPVSWPYHEAPVDCWRIYPAGMEALSRYAGLEVEFSWWGSLESQQSRRTYPGAGSAWDRSLRFLLRARLKRLVGWPVPVAYDMVTIARKH